MSLPKPEGISHEEAPESLAARFWSKVAKSDECWTWEAGRNGRGYGFFTIAGRRVKAHRVAYILAIGNIAPGMRILHHCDNPACVRPDHLFIGTSADNSRDMWAKGRHPTNIGDLTRGVRNRHARLSAAQVEAIKADHPQGRQVLAVAEACGVSVRHVYRITAGERWSHIGEEEVIS